MTFRLNVHRLLNIDIKLHCVVHKVIFIKILIINIQFVFLFNPLLLAWGIPGILRSYKFIKRVNAIYIHYYI